MNAADSKATAAANAASSRSRHSSDESSSCSSVASVSSNDSKERYQSKSNKSIAAGRDTAGSKSHGGGGGGGGGGDGNDTSSGSHSIARNTTTTTTTTTATDQVSSLSVIMQKHRVMLEADTSLDKIVCVDDLEELAEVKLDRSVFDYFGAGSDDELTLRWNREALSGRYFLKPRVMRDVSQVDLTKYIFGDKLSMPIGVSPTALHKMLEPKGEIATVKACDRINALMVLSLFSTTSLEDVAKQAPVCTKWQNIYILKDRKITQNVINRARRYNYRALVVTCDAPILGTRRRDVRNNFTLGHHKLENIQDSRVMSMKDHSSDIFDPSVSWQDLADLKKSVGDTIRVIAKGIMTPEDADEAIRAGVDGIYVSNHGGRQLDGAPSTIEVLPAIVDAVNKRCPVFVDGGFRTGAEILKALALGADMVLVGRPVIWGLACYGEEGAHAALRILRDELKKAMMLCGCTKLSDINRTLVQERQHSSQRAATRRRDT